jgi:hypothetical protein
MQSLLITLFAQKDPSPGPREPGDETDCEGGDRRQNPQTQTNKDVLALKNRDESVTALNRD